MHATYMNIETVAYCASPRLDSSTLSLPGFGEPIRLDRCAEDTGKSIGGGVCIYVNKQWGKNFVIREKIQSSNVELLSVSLRPSYLPREFGQLFEILVYIPPSANNKEAENKIQNHIRRLETLSPDAPKLILGDFNGAVLKNSLPHMSSTCHATHVSTKPSICVMETSRERISPLQNLL